MKPFLKVLLLIALSTCCKTARAQYSDVFTQYFTDGTPKQGTAGPVYGDMDGSPYLYDTWAPGVVRLSDGKAYKDVLLKYDEVAQLLIFKYAENDSPMAFAAQPVEFKFDYITDNKVATAHFLSGFDPVDYGTAATFYQVLATGKTMLLKRAIKSILEVSEFNSAVKTKRIQEQTWYYLANSNKPVRIKNNKKAVLAALSDKQDKLKEFIADNNLDISNDVDFGKLINYYNLL